jgi:hypothetical protein
MVKLCTKIRADVGHVADGVHLVGSIEVIDVSVVADDHEFGVDLDGFLHIEGSVTVEDVRRA